MSRNRRPEAHTTGRGLFGFPDTTTDDDAAADDRPDPRMESALANKVADLLALLQLAAHSADGGVSNGAGAYSREGLSAAGQGWGDQERPPFHADASDESDDARRSSRARGLDQASMPFRLAATLQGGLNTGGSGVYGSDNYSSPDGRADDDDDDDDNDRADDDYDAEEDECADEDELYDDAECDSRDYKDDYPPLTTGSDADHDAVMDALHGRGHFARLARRMRGVYDSYELRDRQADESYASALARGPGRRAGRTSASSATALSAARADGAGLAQVYKDDVDVMERPQPAHTSLTAPDPSSASAFVQALLLSAFDEGLLW